MKTTELKALAEKATPGPWETRTTTHEPAGFVQGPPVDDMPYRAEILGDDYTGFGDDEQKARDVAYVAAANPAAILTLIADLESAQDERRALLATEQNLREELAALKASIGEPVAIVDVVVPHLESFLLKHIPGADFPRVGGFLYAIKDKQP